MNKSEKVAWLYMIEEGDVVSKWSYYAGAWDILPDESDECREGIKKIGINWSKSSPVTGDNESVFAGTFHDSDTVSVTSGKLVLNDGRKFKWGISEALDLTKVMLFVLSKSDIDLTYDGVEIT